MAAPESHGGVDPPPPVPPHATRLTHGTSDPAQS
jgi:hypothetical protein